MREGKILKTVGLAMMAAAMALALSACGLGGAATASSGGDGITVSASSETKVVPDKARISVSIVTEAKEAEKCQSENAKSVNAVVEALKGLGVGEESIQTNYSNLFPRYGSRVTEGKASAKASADDGEKAVAESDVELAEDVSGQDDEAYDEWVITGYEMTTTLSISDLEIDNVGSVVQACVAAGANEASGIEYYASNYDEKYNEALGRALDIAKAKAESIAASTGAGLGRVVNVVEGYQDTSARYVANDYAEEEISADAGAAAKTMPGQLGITAEVTVTYAIS